MLKYPELPLLRTLYNDVLYRDIASRYRLDDWEADAFLGKNHKPVMLSLTERKIRFTLLGKVPQRTAQAVRKQTVRLLLPVSDKVHIRPIALRA